MSEPTTHKELMTAMGSKNGDWDPTAPEWYVRLMESSDPVEQAMAWMQFTTVRYPIRKPYATGEMGRPLTLQDLAAFYRWTQRQAQRVWRKMEAKGYVRKAEGKLWLRADFKVKHPIVREDGSLDAPPPDPIAAYIDTLAPYRKAVVAAMPRAQQAEYVGHRLAYEDWCKKGLAECVAIFREKAEPEGDRIDEAFKVPVKRSEKAPRKPTLVQLELFGAPLLNLSKLTIFDGRPVNGHAQASAVLNSNGHGTDSVVEGTSTPPVAARTADPHAPTTEGRQAGTPPTGTRPGQPTAPPLSPIGTAANQQEYRETLAKLDWDAVGRAAAQYGVSVSDSWQLKMVHECQQRTADVTPQEIAQLIHSVGRQAAKKDSPNGWLLSVIPERCEGNSFRALRERMRQADERDRIGKARQEEQTRETARSILDSTEPTWKEEDREWARGILGIRTEVA